MRCLLRSLIVVALTFQMRWICGIGHAHLRMFSCAQVFQLHVLHQGYVLPMEQVRHASLHCLSLWIHILNDHDEAELRLSVQELTEQIRTTAYAILSKATLTATDSSTRMRQRPSWQNTSSATQHRQRQDPEFKNECALPRVPNTTISNLHGWTPPSEDREDCVLRYVVFTGEEETATQQCKSWRRRRQPRRQLG